MKRYLTSLLFVCAVCLSALAQGAFCVYVKDAEKPTVIANAAIDTIYFDSTNDGKIRQNFVTNEGLLSFMIDDIDRITFNGEKYIKSVRNNLVLPKEGSESELVLVYSGVDNVQEFLNVEKENYKTEWTEGRKAFLKLTVAENKGDERKFTIPFGAEGCYGEIHVRQLSESFLKDSSRFGKFFLAPVRAYVGPEATRLDIPVVSGLDITLLERDWYSFNKLDSEWCKIHPEKNGVLTFEFEENTGEERVLHGIWGSDSLDFRIMSDPYLTYDVDIVQLKSDIHSEEEHMAALRDLYDTCDGKNWTYQENWWSDKPIWEWEGVNHDIWGSYDYRDGHVLRLKLSAGQYSGVRGMLPESFTTIMDDAYEIDLSNCALSGAFPYKITHHPRWPEFGWNFIQQDNGFGGWIDFTGINLQLPDEKLWNYKEEKESSTLTELKKHKLTWVMNAEVNFTVPITSASVPVDFMNKYLDYAPKGLGFIFVKSFWPRDENESPDEYKQYIEENEATGMPKDITWVDHFIEGKGLASNCIGNMSLYDEAGNLIWHAERSWVMDPEYTARLDSIFRKYFGEPVEHEPFVPTLYTSTDYSRDGELMELQKATEGNGINVIFLGDGFVDKDMKPGGKYESEMRSAMDYLFEREPLKSLANRFNVYAIKVVSPNDFQSNSGVQALNHDLNKAAEYIARVLPGVNVAEAHVCIVDNRPSLFISGSSAWHDAGGSFSVLNLGGASPMVLYAVGGRGIGKLLDEFICGNYEDNHTQPGAEEAFRQWIKTDYHDKGWGMNISATDVAEEVPWAHMLKDEYYSKETGIFMGAWFWPTELWRPSENSVMNNNFSWFNAPSREAIYKYVMKTSEGETWTYDFETFKAWDIATQNAAAQEARKAPKVEKDDRLYESAPVRRIVKRNGRYELEPIVAPAFVKKAPREAPRVRTIERDGHTIRIVGK